MIIIALVYINIISAFSLTTSINTRNQHKHDTFDVFKYHSMCHCALKFDIETIVVKNVPPLLNA
jgi:hypothetical protein